MKKHKIILISLLIVLVLLVILLFKTIKTNKQTEEKIKEEDKNFNIRLIKEVNKNQKENYLISPYSIEIALNMLKDGANNNTKKEIEDLVGTRRIQDVSVKDRISIANAAFIKNDYKKYVLDNYYNNLKDKYNSEILYDNFYTPKVINDWVNNKTNGMINKILDEIDKDFVLGLANALAVDVEWKSLFECTKTNKKEFTKIDNSKIEVEMMNQTFETKEYKYLENDNAKGIIIPYDRYDEEGEREPTNGNNLEFIGILPNKDVDNYIDNLTNEEIDNLLKTEKKASDKLHINLSLPRFRYDYELNDFKEILKNLGIKDAFDENKADFTNIMERNEEIRNLYVGTAIHKTHIDLNEKGTKAAAVTFFGLMKATSAYVPAEPKIINIEFNKPFIYIIRDARTKEMLFFGVVYEPNKWEGSTCEEESNLD